MRNKRVIDTTWLDLREFGGRVVYWGALMLAAGFTLLWLIGCSTSREPPPRDYLSSPLSAPPLSQDDPDYQKFIEGLIFNTEPVVTDSGATITRKPQE